MSSTDVIDQDALDRLEGWGGKRLLLQMIRLFLDNAPERLREIGRGLDGGDLETVERAAHGLKSSAANLGAREVAELAGRLEQAAGAGAADEARDLALPLKEAQGRAAQRLSVVEKEASG